MRTSTGRVLAVGTVVMGALEPGAHVEQRRHALHLLAEDPEMLGADLAPQLIAQLLDGDGCEAILRWRALTAAVHARGHLDHTYAHTTGANLMHAERERLDAAITHALKEAVAT